MAELSGVAKLSNGEPASQIVAVHPLRGHVRSAVPAPDGSYAIPGVPKGKWLVTAEGPAGYRPLTHVLDVERVPEAETLYPKIWEAWNFNANRVGQKQGSVFSGTSAGSFVPGRDGEAITDIAGTHGYSPGVFQHSVLGYATWFKRPSAGASRLPTVDYTPAESGFSSTMLDAQFLSNSLRMVVGGRLAHNTARPALTVPVDIPTGEWVFVCIVVTTTSVIVWVGTERFDFPQSNAVGLTNFPRLISLKSIGTNSHVDDLFQLTQVPTDDEVAYLYNAGLGRSWENVHADAGFA